MTKYLVLSFLFLTACNPLFPFELGLSNNTPTSKFEPVITPAAETEAPKAKAATTGECGPDKAVTDDLDIKSVMPPQMIINKRYHQQVVRKDCDGRVVSDKMEQISIPSHQFPFSLQASSDREYKSVFLLNKTTCDHVLTAVPGNSFTNLYLAGTFYSVTGTHDGQLNISGDLANALLTFHMADGWNELYVRYYYDCRPSNVGIGSKVQIGESTCDESKDSRLEKYLVHVKEVDETLDGILEIKPTAEECQKK